jgi:ATP-binding protein involved in chromosome partitioning
MFNKVNVPVLGIVENMSYFICSHCGQKENIFDIGGGKRMAHELNVPFLGEIPIDTKVRVGGDKGDPIVHGEPESQQGKIIQAIARQLAAQISIQYLGTPSVPKVEILLPNQN